MTDAEFHQQTLELRQQELWQMTEAVRDALIHAPFEHTLGLIEETKENTFTIFGFDGGAYKITVTEK